MAAGPRAVDLAAIATGSWDQICGITTAGQVVCGGTGATPYGNPPKEVGAAGQTSLWVDTRGVAQLSDATTLRPAESRPNCQVQATGLVCGATSYGPSNGTVVMGNDLLPGLPYGACWLTDDGKVSCTTGPRFAAGKVLYLASSFYTDSLCAIYNDGSIWYVGSNTSGKLGTGNELALTQETMVAPAGTARVRCD